MQRNQTNWSRSFFNTLCPESCTFGVVQTTTICSVCSSFTSTIIIIVPPFLSALLMNFLPLFIQMIVKLLDNPSSSQNWDTQFNILFVFQIMIMGITQVAFPNMINVKDGTFNVAFLSDLSIQDFI